MTGNGQYPPPPQGPGQPQRPPSLPWPPPGHRQPQPQGPPPGGGYGQPYPPNPPQPAPQYPQNPPYQQNPGYQQPYQQPYPQQQQQWPPNQFPPPPPPPPPPGPRGPYGPWQQPPRRKKGMGAAGILGIVFGSMAALFVLIVVISAVASGSRREYTPVALPTSSSTQSPYDALHPPTEYTPTPEESTTATEESTPTHSDEPTQNQVDPPAKVQVNTSLTGNTLYKAGGLPRSTCRAGNANIFSHSQLRALILKTGQCMSRVWGPVLQRQGITFRAPNYAIAARGGRGACGDYPSPGSMVPYYCPRNNTIYASTSAMARGNGNARGYGQIIQWNGGIISMMAHEYGHHVQTMSGVMDSWWNKTLATSGQSSKLGLSRRLELQATCLGGMWMRSVASSYPVSSSNRNRLFSFYGQVGDYPGWPRDHGAPVNNNRWFRQGWIRNQAYQCNTWAAPSSTTS